MTRRAPEPPDFELDLRVYYEDTDAGGVVYYANYLRYMERARTEWLRGLGLAHAELRARHGLQFVVSAASVRYFKPARLDDLLGVGVTLRRLGRASLELIQDVRRGNEMLCRGQIRAACVDAESFRPRPMPATLMSGATGAPST